MTCVSGKLAWVFHTVPERGEAGAETWPEAALATGSGVHNWAELTVDVARGIAFIPTGTARYDFYGGNRHGANLYANSLLALDAKTGKRIWHFQTIHHDLWDWDLATSPKLLTVRHDGRDVDVVAQASKHGFLFVLERDSGRPLWPIEERPVPQSDVPGEQTSPTQPFPTAPPPFARQSFTEKDINPHLPPEAQEKLRQLLRNSVNKGLFTPPSLQGSIQMPGNSGGANWGLAAVDPMKGRVYVMSKESPDLLRLRAMKPGDKPENRGPDPNQVVPGAPAGFVAYTAVDPYGFTGDTATGMPPITPPWSQITAYDLNKGTILWQVPNGDSTLLIPRGLRGTGSHQARAGMVVTAGGLIFIGTPDNTLRAYDEDSGKVVWEKAGQRSRSTACLLSTSSMAASTWRSRSAPLVRKTTTAARRRQDDPAASTSCSRSSSERVRRGLTPSHIYATMFRDRRPTGRRSTGPALFLVARPKAIKQLHGICCVHPALISHQSRRPGLVLSFDGCSANCPGRFSDCVKVFDTMSPDDSNVRLRQTSRRMTPIKSPAVLLAVRRQR